MAFYIIKAVLVFSLENGVNTKQRNAGYKRLFERFLCGKTPRITFGILKAIAIVKGTMLFL